LLKNLSLELFLIVFIPDELSVPFEKSLDIGKMLENA
jgi:hypothetical protein